MRIYINGGYDEADKPGGDWQQCYINVSGDPPSGYMFCDERVGGAERAFVWTPTTATVTDSKNAVLTGTGGFGNPGDDVTVTVADGVVTIASANLGTKTLDPRTVVSLTA